MRIARISRLMETYERELSHTQVCANDAVRIDPTASSRRIDCVTDCRCSLRTDAGGSEPLPALVLLARALVAAKRIRAGCCQSRLHLLLRPRNHFLRLLLQDQTVPLNNTSLYFARILTRNTQQQSRRFLMLLSSCFSLDCPLFDCLAVAAAAAAAAAGGGGLVRSCVAPLSGCSSALPQPSTDAHRSILLPFPSTLTSRQLRMRPPVCARIPCSVPALLMRAASKVLRRGGRGRGRGGLLRGPVPTSGGLLPALHPPRPGPGPPPLASSRSRDTRVASAPASSRRRRGRSELHSLACENRFVQQRTRSEPNVFLAGPVENRWFWPIQNKVLIVPHRVTPQFRGGGAGALPRVPDDGPPDTAARWRAGWPRHGAWRSRRKSSPHGSGARRGCCRRRRRRGCRPSARARALGFRRLSAAGRGAPAGVLSFRRPEPGSGRSWGRVCWMCASDGAAGNGSWAGRCQGGRAEGGRQLCALPAPDARGGGGSCGSCGSSGSSINSGGRGVCRSGETVGTSRHFEGGCRVVRQSTVMGEKPGQEVR